MNGDAATLPTLSALLAERARTAPDRPAILAPGRQALTYGALHQLAQEQHTVLRERGIGHADRVAVVLPDGYDTAACAMAVAANAVCVPINPTLRGPELRALFRRLQPSAVVASPGSPAAGAAAEVGASLFRLAGRGEPAGRLTAASGLVSNRLASARSAERPEEEDIAFLLATSGTTARAKLVPLTHRNVLAAATATVRAYEIDECDRRLNFMPLYHVQGLVGSVTASLVAHGSIVCTPGFEARRVPEWVREWGATWFSATPTMYQEILRSGAGGLAELGSAGLRFTRVGSSALPQTQRSQIEDAFLLPVVESYGMTEAHQIASTPLDRRRHRAGAVGPPTGSAIAILLPNGGGFGSPGELGEVVIRGANVVDGYVDDPQANRECFVDGWFRTGDLGLLDEAGYLVLRGRLKEIINRGGEKISPHEVDEALLEHPSVVEAVTFPVPDPTLQEAVGAAVVLDPDARLDEVELRRFASSRLAPHKVPRHIRFVEAIPRTAPGGKIRRDGLAAQIGVSVSDTHNETMPAAPAGGVESAVRGIWKEVLALPEIGLDDDFFFLGGDSLTGAQVLAMVFDVFGIELDPFAMYDKANTIAGMAHLIRGQRASSR